MSSKPNQKEQMFSDEALLPTPPWAQTFIHTCSWGRSKPPDTPSSTPRSCFWRGDSEGGGGKPLLAVPSLLAGQVTVSGLWRCSCGRRLETGKQHPAQMASCCSALHLLACRSPLKNASITVSPRLFSISAWDQGKQEAREYWTQGPSVFSIPPPLSAPQDTHKAHCQQCVQTSMHTSPDSPAESDAPKPCSRMWSGGHLSPSLPSF